LTRNLAASDCSDHRTFAVEDVELEDNDHRTRRIGAALKKSWMWEDRMRAAHSSTPMLAGRPSVTDQAEYRQAVLRKVTRRFLPLLGLCYIVLYLDRSKNDRQLMVT